MTIRRLTTVSDAEVRGLAEVLVDIVEGGDSVGFMDSLPLDRAEEFCRRIAGSAARGERALLIAEDERGIIGTVHLVLEQPENQPHRADLSKMLVHRRARRRGVGAALLAAAEQVAIDEGRTRLVLDPASADAERLYARAGWIRVGVIPGFALMPDGAPCATTLFYRELAGTP
jgi:GNAT superfamily N-acetyltransferase